MENKNISATTNKSKSRKDASEDDTEEDSDFEDPDEIEVPGGGKDLDTIRKITGSSVPSAPKATPGNIFIQNIYRVSASVLKAMAIIVQNNFNHNF